MNKLDNFINRLSKMGINIEAVGNLPWVYIKSINGRKVTETFMSEHGFVLGYVPIKEGQEFKFSDLHEIFKLIRRVCYDRRTF